MIRLYLYKKHINKLLSPVQRAQSTHWHVNSWKPWQTSVWQKYKLFIDLHQAEEFNFVMASHCLKEMPQKRTKGEKKAILEVNVWSKEPKQDQIQVNSMLKGIKRSCEVRKKPKPNNKEIQVLYMPIKRTTFHWISVFYTFIHINANNT